MVARSLDHEVEGVIIAGIDTHKDTLAVAVIDHAGRPIWNQELANTEVGFDQVETIVATRGVSLVGIEGSGNFGRGIACRLVLGERVEVVEVPPSLTSRERSGRPGGGETDTMDASPSPGSPPASHACHRCGSPSVTPPTCEP